MSSTAQTLSETITDALVSLHGPVLMVHPSVEIIDAVVRALRDDENAVADGQVRILAAPDVLKETRDAFPTATAAASLVEEGRLSLRSAESPTRQFLLVTENEVQTLITADGAAVRVGADDAEFTSEASETFAAEWERADEFDLRTPGLTRLLETLRAEIGTDTRDDFETMLRSLDADDTEEYNEVELSLLAAAKNRVLLYDLSRWGEDVGLASKATFSRTKTRLEDQGYLDTEKVPIDVGRPRLRLTLTEEGQIEVERNAPAPAVGRSDA